MNNTFAFTLIVVASILALAHGTDYCRSDLCVGSTHIACGHNGQFDPRCPSDTVQVNLTPEMKQAFIDRHNQHRNFIAGGGDSKLSPACRMTEMRWDDEMSSIVALNTKQCLMKHDACRDTDTFKYSGQNLAQIPFKIPYNFTDLIYATVDMWYSERKDTYQQHIDAYPNVAMDPPIGHFTVMVAEKATYLGCAITSYWMPDFPAFQQHFVGCNYASTNIVGLPIYKSCSVAASKCVTGVNCNYRNLCKATEPIDPNDIWN